MSQACTLICSSNKFSLSDLLKKFVSDAECMEERSADVVVVSVDDVTIKFTVKKRKRPGDEYSHLILSFGTHFRDVRTKAKKNKQLILQAIMHAEALIGVVADPGFDERTDGVLLGLAQSLDALIFTGAALLNGKGELVLDNKGKFSIEL